MTRYIRWSLGSVVRLRDVRSKTILVLKLFATMLTGKCNVGARMMCDEVLLHVAPVSCDFGAKITLHTTPTPINLTRVVPNKRLKISINCT